MIWIKAADLNWQPVQEKGSAQVPIEQLSHFRWRWAKAWKRSLEWLFVNCNQRLQSSQNSSKWKAMFESHLLTWLTGQPWICNWKLLFEQSATQNHLLCYWTTIHYSILKIRVLNILSIPSDKRGCNEMCVLLSGLCCLNEVMWMLPRLNASVWMQHCNSVNVDEWMWSECGVVHTTCCCKDVLHKCWGSWLWLNLKVLGNSVQEIIELKHTKK